MAKRASLFSLLFALRHLKARDSFKPGRRVQEKGDRVVAEVAKVRKFAPRSGARIRARLCGFANQRATGAVAAPSFRRARRACTGGSKASHMDTRRLRTRLRVARCSKKRLHSRARVPVPRALATSPRSHCFETLRARPGRVSPRSLANQISIVYLPV